MYVSNNGVDFDDDENAAFKTMSMYSYYVEPTLDSILPAFVSPDDETEVRIMGNGFFENDKASCRIGSQVVPAKVSVPAQTVTCKAPRHFVGSTVQVKVSVSQNGQDFSDNAVDLTYTDSPVIYSLWPRHGPSRGHNLVKIYGANFDYKSKVFIQFGPITVPATVKSNNEATAIAPPHSVGKIDVRLVDARIDNYRDVVAIEEDWKADYGLTYEYLDEVHISMLFPNNGPTSGGTAVTLRGKNFPPLPSLLCLFDNNLSEATLISETEILCTSPPSENSTVEINVGIMDAENSFVSLSMAAAQFTYYNVPRIVGVYPRQGLVAGGTSVTIAVDDMPASNEIKCRFNDIEVPGELVSGGVVICQTPSREAASIVDLHISFNDHDYHSAGQFAYHEGIVVLSATPSHGFVRGGAIVKAAGVGFPPPDGAHDDMFCDFGGRTAFATYINETLVECIAPAHIEAAVKLSLVYFPGKEAAEMRSESNATFSYVPEIELSYTFPSLLPAQAMDTNHLEVYGSNFLETEELSCRFEVSLPSNSTKSTRRNVIVETEATYFNSTYIDCGAEVPGLDAFFSDAKVIAANDDEVVSGSTALLSVTTNGQDWSDSVPLTFAVDCSVASIYPALGSVAGGTRVIVRGERFRPTSTLACQFGNLARVLAEYKSETEILCTSPPNANKSIVPVQITINGRENFSADDVMYRYHDPISLLSINPRMSPSVGGVTTSISLDGLVDEDMDLVCKFNTTVIEAELSSSSSIACVAPAAHAGGGQTLVDVSTNGGVDWTGAELDFFYLPGQHSETMRLTPSHGPMSGGTTVRVEGLAGLQDEYTSQLASDVDAICRFGSVVGMATDITLDGKFVYCTSPPSAMNGNLLSVAVDVALSSEEALTSAGAIYSYDEPVRLTDLFPSTGPVTGMTPVRIFGGPFVGAENELLCRFGNIIVPGIWHSKSEISCVVPEVEVAEGNPFSVPVDVSINGGADFTSSNLTYKYHQIVTVSMLQPNHGPVSGGTSLILTGHYFDDMASLSCWFGKAKVTPKLFNSTTLLCTSPPVLRPTTVQVHVSINGFEPRYDISPWAQNFTYEEELDIAYSTPPSGPSRGNTSVLIKGGPFVDHTRETNQMFCRFGNVAVPATFISENEIECFSPPHAQEIVQLEVTQNGQDYSETDFAYEYYGDIVVSHFEPSFGPARGGTEIHIVGTGFLNSTLTMCRFGDDTLVPARFVNGTEIICLSPYVNETEMEWFGLNQIALNKLEGTAMFDRAHSYPSYLGKATTVEVYE